MSLQFEVLRAPWPLNVPAPPVVDAVARPRLDSVDLLRGLVMVVMALDHTRDFFGGSGVNPRDVADPALFLTRWITHFCAPTFIFLAGVSAYLYGTRGRSTGEVSRFLLTRGLWLILIELTVVRFGWTFNFSLDFFVFQVIWAIGASMVVLAGAGLSAALRRSRAVGITMIAGHNLLDGIRAGRSARRLDLEYPASAGAPERGEGYKFALYSLIPWVGVMAAGYALGPLFQLEPAPPAAHRAGRCNHRRICAAAREQPLRRSAHGRAGQLAATYCHSSIVEKYPPSLLYLSMTLGRR